MPYDHLLNDEEDMEQELLFSQDLHHLSASKIADQFWCEMQLHFKLIFGQEPTEAMIAGSKVHRHLEEELGPVIEVETTTEEDQLLSYLLVLYTKLQMLYQKGITRELPVFGIIKDIPCLGIIDQLAFEETKEGKKLVITDFKTRNSKRAPSYEQKRRNRIQLQVYWFLLQNLKKGFFSKKSFKEFFEINKKLIPSEDLLHQLPEQLQTILTENPSEKLILKIFEMFQELPDLSRELQAVYLHRIDKTIVHTDRTIFHTEAFEVDINWAIEYWQGKRTPNECPQKWMCKFCPFTDKCPYYLRRYYREEEKKSKKKEKQNLLDYIEIEKKKWKKTK